MKPLTRLFACSLLLSLFVTAAPAGQQNKETEDLLQSAARLYRDKKYEESLAVCLKAASLSPKDFRPRAMAGSLYMILRKMNSASESFAEAIRVQPQRRELYLAKAEADRLRNAREEAIAAARRATEIDPNYAEAYAMLGELLQYDVNRRDEAINALRMAVKLNPTAPNAYQNLGELFLQAKDEKTAEEIFRQGMAADPKRMAGRFPLGRLLVKQGRLAEARKLWDERTSDKDNTYPQFIEVLKRAENVQRVTDELARKPDDPATLVEMGLTLMEGDHWVVDGRQRRALVYFRKALELKPDFARAQYGVCKAYIQGVDYPKDESKIVDEELANLRKLDPAMAAELDDYRKKYVRGIIGAPIKSDQ